MHLTSWQMYNRGGLIYQTVSDTVPWNLKQVRKEEEHVGREWIINANMEEMKD